MRCRTYAEGRRGVLTWCGCGQLALDARTEAALSSNVAPRRGAVAASVEEMAEMKVLDEELSHEDDYEVVMRMRREAVVDRANSRGLHTKADE